MDTSKIFNNDSGGWEIPNPKYKKGSKKQPKTVTTDNFFLTSGDNTAPGVNDFYKASKDTFQMTDTEKYSEYGITPNKISKSLNNDLANAQGTFHKFANAVAQAAVSEVALGTVKAFSDIADSVGQLIGLSDHDYSNPVSQYLEEKQEEFKNYAPIYTQDGVDISNGGLLNAGWWASQMPSVMSSLTLLIPSTTIVKGVGLVGKIGKVSSFTRKAGALGIKAARGYKLTRPLASVRNIELAKEGVVLSANAMLQRTMENYQEARGVYTDMYKETQDHLNSMNDAQYADWVEEHKDKIGDVDYNDKDAVAKAVSRKAADEDFKDNYVNSISDIIQMYALKNSFGNRLANIGRYSSNKVQRNLLREIGNTVNGAEGEAIKQSFAGKAGDVIKNGLFGAKLAIIGQLSEGVEEGVNYISQQEGMQVGRTLIGTGRDSSFDSRLQSYMKDPQLWESAFWGVLGGVVFEAGGSALNRVSYNLKNNKKGEEVDPVTGEKVNKPTWNYDHLPEIKRKIAEIEGRMSKITFLGQKIKAIDDGYNPYLSTDGKKVAIKKNEIEALKNRAVNEFVTDIALDAQNNGNSDLLDAFMRDDNVRKLFAKEGATSDADSKAFQESIIKKIGDVREEYENQINHLDNLSIDVMYNKNIKDENGNTIETPEFKNGVPFEYLQLIASENVRRHIGIDEAVDRQNDAMTRYRAAIERGVKEGKLDENADYDEALETRANIMALAQLENERTRVSSIDRTNPSIAAKLRIRELDLQIKKLRDTMYGDKSRTSVAKALYNLAQTIESRRANIPESDKAALDILQQEDDAIMGVYERNDFTGAKNILGLENEKDTLTEEEHKAFKKDFDEHRKSTLKKIEELNKYFGTEVVGNEKDNTDGNNGIESEEKENEAIAAYDEAYLERFNVAQEKSRIVSTVPELINKLAFLNNTMEEVRSTKLKEASKTIEDMLEKYSRSTIEGAAFAMMNGDDDAFNSNTETYSAEDKSALKDALTIFNFANPSNLELYRMLNGMLTVKELEIKRRKEQQKKNTIGNENLAGSDESTLVDNNTGNGEEAAVGQQSSPTGNSNAQNTAEQTQTNPNESQNGTTNSNDETNDSEDEDVEVRFDKKGKVNNRGSLKVATKRRKNGEIELKLANTSENGPMFANDALYDKTEDVSLIDDNWEVSQNPIIKKNDKGQYEVVRKGLITKIDLNQKSNPASADVDGINSSPVEERGENNEVAEHDDNVPQELELNFKSESESEDNKNVDNNKEDNKENNNKEDNSEDKKSTANNSSTGEREAKPIEEPNPVGDREILNDPRVIINGDVIGIIKGYKEAGIRPNMDMICKAVYDKYIKTGIEEDILNAIINEIRANSIYNMLIDKVNKALEAIVDVQEAQSKKSSIQETDEHGNNVRSFSEIYSKAADNLFNEYLKVRDGIVVTDENGNEKIYFSFQDLLNWCNEVSQTSDMAAGLYGYLKQYILDRSADENYKYRIVDADALDATTLFDDKNSLQIKPVDDNSNRLNIKQLIGDYLASENREELNKLLKTLDNLKAGDSLNISVKNGRLIVSANNVAIGSLAIPKVSMNYVDHYLMYNNNWVYEVGIDGESKLKDLFQSWIREETDAGKELNPLMLRLAFDTSLSKGDKKKLIKQIIKTKAIQDSIGTFINVSSNTDIDGLTEAVEGLARLYRYVAKQYNRIVNTEHEYKLADILSDSIDDFFVKLRKTYETIDAVSRNPKAYESTVDYISSGRVTTIVDTTGGKNTVEAEKKAKPVKESVADKFKDSFEFGFIPTGRDSHGQRTSGVVYGTNGTKVDYPGTPGNTFGIITDESGKPHLVRAYPTHFRDGRQTKEVKAIQESIKEELTNLIEDFYAKKPGSYERLREFLNKVFNNKNRLISRGFLADSNIIIRDFGNFKGFNIAIEGQPFSINISNNTYNGELQFSTSVSTDKGKGKFYSNGENKAEVLKMLHSFVGNSGIGIHFDALNNSMNEAYPFSGFMSRGKNGEFVVTIPNSKTGKATIITAKSYKDFLVDNNLVKLNLKKTKDVDGSETNFTRFDENNQLSNQTAYVSFKPKEVSETIKPKEVSKKTVSEARVEKAIEILTSTDKRVHKGRELAKLVLGNEVTHLIKPVKGYSLLPKNIIFDENFNNRPGYETYNAEFDPKTETITVGRKWLNMLANPATKNEAIRKLVHEQLHYILNKNENSKYVTQLEAIRQEFIEANERDGLAKGQGVRRYENITSNPIINLEEFLVESMTSKELANRLNEIDAEPGKKSRRKSLFQKIMEVLADVFGWDIRKGSLYEKEFNALADIFAENDSVAESNNQQNETLEDNSSPVEELTDSNVDNPKNDTEDNFDKEFETDIDFDDMFRSSVDEEIIVPSIKSFVDSIPIEDRANLRERINDGEIETKCR